MYLICFFKLTVKITLKSYPRCQFFLTESFQDTAQEDQIQSSKAFAVLDTKIYKDLARFTI